jgi:hypothetical protein
MSCKVYLVPEDVIQSWRAEQRDRAMDQPVTIARQTVDSNMGTVLESDKSDYDKYLLFAQEMAKFQQYREQQQQPLTRPMTSVPTELEDQLLSSIPKTYKTKASALWKYLKSDKDVQWDEHGRLILRGQVIPQSHMIDLVHDALRPRKKAKRAAGWSELSHHLAQNNIPQELIGNPEWNTSMESPVRKMMRREKVQTVPKSMFTPVKQNLSASFATPPRTLRKKLTDWLNLT